jgi:hypothetical protein
VFLFVLYAVAIWFAAARWRRQWGSFASVLAGLAGLVLIGYAHYRLSVITHGRINLPVLQSLLYPYSALVTGIGLYIAALPRKRLPWEHCPKCQYDLRGLDQPIEVCPECGMTDELARITFGREYRGFPAAGLSPAPPATPRPAPAPGRAAPQWPATAAARVCLDPGDE